MGGPASQGAGATPSMDGPSLSGPTVLRILLGARLRELRLARHIMAEQAAYVIRASQSKISRLESGQVSFKERDVADLLTHYGLTDPAEREALLEMARQSNAPGWWHRYSDVVPSWFHTYLGLEEAAGSIRAFETVHIPALLQTREYAAALHTRGSKDVAADTRERLLDFTARRQRLLQRANAPHLWFVIDEGVLLRQVGDRETMRAQLEHLAGVTRLPNVTVQILPSAAPRLGSSPFHILRFLEPSLPDLVFVQHLTGALYLDRAAEVDVYYSELDRLAVAARTPEDSRDAVLAMLGGLDR
ncbi:helix-turn-helix domain-containing protein [Actinomadura sp. ATCC 31491]|uniref:Helix-turn-helix domain-containing protein n=1 Tax=Actinomadura luzonensis TaxID=2805427 RepID=A0ABT0FP01_9ACTN|nr:helix-turn-helix transcriptional regulator [Actinomadura luzonensis]MCK2214077.1 helix-turn-helix domain-containing protein [Actinomadura luzonensis]